MRRITLGIRNIKNSDEFYRQFVKKLLKFIENIKVGELLKHRCF